VFDRALRLPPESVLARTARETPTVVVGQGGTETRERALRALGVDVLHAAGPAEALHRLREQFGVRALLGEGGERLAGSLLEQSLVDRLVIFQAPVVLGAGALGAFSFAPPAAEGELRRLPVLERREVGDDVMTVYAMRASR
jgi:diaminohydroxyphosphoribosylaminopyrimidine deaminase / 5-amino-6-(5-phosphoribosylamino)uracil reductase